MQWLAILSFAGGTTQPLSREHVRNKRGNNNNAFDICFPKPNPLSLLNVEFNFSHVLIQM